MPLRSVVAWVAVLPWAAWAVVRVFGLERAWPLVALVSFTVWAVAGALAATLLALVLRRRIAALVGALALLALAAVVAPRAIGGGDEARAGERPLRVLTINLLGSGARSDAVVALARRLRVDVLSVQELTPEAADALDAAGIRAVLPDAVLEARTRARGGGLYARVPLRGTRAPGDTYFVWAAAVARVPRGRDVLVVSVHPRAPTGGAALGDWRDDLRSLPSGGAARPTVLAGDFNATLDHRELRAVLDRGYVDAAERSGAGLRTTWPRGRRIPPTITIDHVLADARMGVGDVAIHDVPGTDHRAVFAELFVPAR